MMPDAFAGIFIDFKLSVDAVRTGWERIRSTGLCRGDGGRVVVVYAEVGEGVRPTEGDPGGAGAGVCDWEMLAARTRSAARAASLAQRTVFERVGGGGGGITGAGERGTLEGAPAADEHFDIGS